MAQHIRTGCAALVLALGVLALTGCDHLRLYSPGLDEQGQKAQKAWKEVNLAGVVQAERERSAALLKQEAAYRETSTLASRDLKLLTIATSPSLEASLKAPVNAALRTLVGDGAFYTDLKAAREKEVSAASQYENGAQEFRVRGLEMPSCKDILSGEAAKSVKELPNSGHLLGALSVGVTACTPTSTTDPNAVRKLLKCTKLSGKALEQCTASMPRLQAEIEALYALEAAKDAKPNANARNDYRVAVANYKTLSDSPVGSKPAAAGPAASAPATGATAPGSAASAPEGPTQTKLKEAFEKLKAAVAKLSGFEDKLSLQLISEERLSAIESLLSPKAAGAEGETDKDRVGRALQRLAETADGWKATKASAAEVLGRPLIAQQEVERLQIQALNRAIGVDTVEIEWRRRVAALTEEQADHYQAASKALEDPEATKGSLMTVMYGTEGNKTAKPPVAAVPPASLDVRTKVMGAVADYGYAVGHLQGQYEAATLQLQAVDGMRRLDVGESNLRQWEVLIGMNVDVLATWAAAGVKDETISRGINALLLLWIGYGVN
jgi:hypothetical protein